MWPAVRPAVCECMCACYPPVVLSVTCWKFSEPQVLHRSGGDKWLLRVVQDVSQCIHTHVEVGDVDTHRLFAHSGLVRVPRRLGAQQRLRDLDRVGLVPKLWARSDWSQSGPDLWTRLYLTGVRVGPTGTWLWSGKGMMEAQTPRIMDGWISQCV